VVRACGLTREADNSWRAIDTRDGQIYELTDTSETEDRAWIEALATAKAGDRVVL
jgi:hypothetical protein